MESSILDVTLGPQLVLWYAITLLLGTVVFWAISRAQTRFRKIVWYSDPELSWGPVLWAGVKEEMIFRGIPAAIAVHTLELGGVAVFGVLMVANGIWAGVHVRDLRTVGFVWVLGVFLSLFWVQGFDGLWWMAIVVHTTHNAISFALA